MLRYEVEGGSFGRGRWSDYRLLRKRWTEIIHNSFYVIPLLD